MCVVMACETPHPLISSIQMLKRNEAAKVWQYRFYITQPNGKSFDYRKTSRCEDFEKACIVAYDAYRRETGKIESGERVSLSPDTTVHDCYLFAKKLYLQDIEDGEVRKSTWQSLEKYCLRDIDPELGTTPVKSINQQAWLKFRATLSEKKPHLSPRTREYIKSALVMCLNAAIDMEVIDEIPPLERKSRTRKRKNKRQPLVWFNLRSQQILLNALDKNVESKLATKRKNEIEQAENLRDYVHLALYTGMRTEELHTLTFNEIEKIQRDRKNKTKVAIINLHPKEGRKTGGRRFTGVNGSGQAIERIMKRRGVDLKSNELVFPQDNKKKFSETLDQYKLRFDKNGNRRTRGTLRHTFICNRICEGMDLASISLKAGNSAKVIEDHYSRGLEDIDKQEYQKLFKTLEREQKRKNEFDADWD